MNAARMDAAAGLIDQVKAAGGSVTIHGGTIKALSVPAELLPELRAHKAEIMQLLTPAADGMRQWRTPKPITRAVLRFKLTDGGGTVLGQPDDTPASLLADLRDKWPDELLAVWNGDAQMYP